MDQETGTPQQETAPFRTIHNRFCIEMRILFVEATGVHLAWWQIHRWPMRDLYRRCHRGASRCLWRRVKRAFRQRQFSRRFNTVVAHESQHREQRSAPDPPLKHASSSIFSCPSPGQYLSVHHWCRSGGGGTVCSCSSC